MPKRNDHYTFRTIKVDRFEARADVSVNVNLRINHLWADSDDETVFGLSTSLEIFGASIDPNHSSGTTYEITFYSDETKIQELRLKNIRSKDTALSLEGVEPNAMRSRVHTANLTCVASDLGFPLALRERAG
jgi:hypothetical protein